MQLSNRDHSSDHSFEGRKVKKCLATLSAEQSYQSALFNQSTKTDGMKERKSCSAARPEEDRPATIDLSIPGLGQRHTRQTKTKMNHLSSSTGLVPKSLN